jgi:hypothetical protein
MPNEINLEQWEKFAQHPRLGEILLQHKKITVPQMEQALLEQKNLNLPVGEILIKMNFITKDDLIEILNLQSNIDKLLAESMEELKKGTQKES